MSIQDTLQSLSLIKPGETVEIIDIASGIELWTRLESMGLFPECHAQVLTNYGQGPLLLSLGDNRIMVGRGMAEKIIVKPDGKE